MEFAEMVRTVVQTIEVLAVAILAGGVGVVFVRALIRAVSGTSFAEIYPALREGLGRVLLLGLEVLIAADIIATVALEPTLSNAASLGLIVLIRTFLTWSIEMETDGRWPWQGAKDAHAASGDAKSDPQTRPA